MARNAGDLQTAEILHRAGMTQSEEELVFPAACVVRVLSLLYLLSSVTDFLDYRGLTPALVVTRSPCARVSFSRASGGYKVDVA